MEKNLYLVKEINRLSRLLNAEQNAIKGKMNEIINEIQELNNYANEHEKLLQLEIYYDKLYSKMNY